MKKSDWKREAKDLDKFAEQLGNDIHDITVCLRSHGFKGLTVPELDEWLKKIIGQRKECNEMLKSHGLPEYMTTEEMDAFLNDVKHNIKILLDHDIDPLNLDAELSSLKLLANVSTQSILALHQAGFKGYMRDLPEWADFQARAVKCAKEALSVLKSRGFTGNQKKDLECWLDTFTTFSKNVVDSILEFTRKNDIALEEIFDDKEITAINLYQSNCAKLAE